MSDDQQQHFEPLRQALLERLRVLELQAVQFGLNAPPHILAGLCTADGRRPTIGPHKLLWY
jgi:hypothetical protein